MKYIKILSCAALMTGASFGSAFAGCGIESGRISILANDFPALHAVVSKAEECAGGAVTFAKNHTAKHQELQGPGWEKYRIYSKNCNQRIHCTTINRGTFEAPR